MSTRTVHPDGLPTPQRYWSMLAIAVGITLSVLDASVVNIALPAMSRQLGTTPEAAIWIVNAYQLVLVVTLLPLSSLGERVGYRRVYQTGVAVFTLGSLACVLSHSLTVLVLSRTVQGLGAAGIMSVNGALVRFTYPKAGLGRGVGLNAMVVSLAAALGPTIAAGILAVGSWQWLFAVNLPIGAVNFLLAVRALPENELSSRPLDWISAGLNALSFGVFFIATDALTRGSGNRVVAAVAVAAALLVGMALVRREVRAREPLLPLDLLRIPLFALSVAASICAFAAYALAFLALPFYFETVLHRDQVQTGLLMTPWPVAVGLLAPLAGGLSDHVPAAILGFGGLLVLASGLALLAVLPAHASGANIAWRMALCGAGFGCFQSPNNRTMLSTAPRPRAGAAGGTLAIARLLGMTVGATLAALVFHAAPRTGESTCLLIGAGLAAVAAAISLSRLGRRGVG